MAVGEASGEPATSLARLDMPSGSGVRSEGARLPTPPVSSCINASSCTRTATAYESQYDLLEYKVG